MVHSHRFELAPPPGASDHTIGTVHARVGVVEYGDFECPNCKQAMPVVKLLVKEFGGHLAFTWRHFPLEEVHPHALNAAEAAECAGEQAKFWPMHDLLFEHQQALKLHHLREYAARLELDLVRFDAEMKDTVYLQRVREHQESGLASGVRATPTFFVDGKILDVSFGVEALFDKVRSALSK